MMPKRLTQADFLAVSRTKHGNRYSYKRAVYTSSSSMVTIGCRKHGYFEQTAKHHMKGFGCNKCAREESGRARSLTQAEFIARSRAKHADRYTYSNVVFINTAGYVSVTCAEHGDFRQQALAHMRGQGCPKCSRVEQGSGAAYRLKRAQWRGRTVEYQGYELKAAEFLVHSKGVNPQEIVFSRDGGVPVIPYMRKGRMHNHFPDMWLPKRNMLIEVKSLYTFQRERSKNLIKMVAAERRGYRYRLMVVDGKGVPVLSTASRELQVVRGIG